MSSLKIHLLSVFREIFIPHFRSLEFRAKIFAAMLLAKDEINEDDFKILDVLGREIYDNDSRRVGVLLAITKEYIKKANVYKSLNLDTLLMDIDNELKIYKRYVRKIDFSHLRRLISEDEEEALTQQRVYEFFVSEVKYHSKR